MFGLVGWRVSGGRKAPDFAESFVGLGVVFSLGDVVGSVPTVSTKPSRAQDIGSAIRGALAA
eukprot:4752857-Amphidinium_carterae.1